MRIAIVINTAWNIYNFRMGLIRSFLDKNYEVHTIAPPDGYEKHLIQEGCKHHLVTLENKGTNPRKDISYIYQLYKLYKKIRPDVILHFTIKPNLYGTVAAKLLGIPVINNVSGLGTVFLRENRSSKIARELYKYVFKFPDKVFFQNSDDLQYFIEKGLVNQRITDLLPGSGVNIQKFQPEVFKRNSKFTFLLAARLIQDKGIHEYAEAARIVLQTYPDIRFLLVGFKDESPFGVKELTLQNWIDQGVLEYLGPTDDIQSVFRHADCVVLPSYREGTPRSLLEAAAMAKPIIATNVPGCIEVVDDQINGFLCEAKNGKDLAEKMIKMLSLSDHDLQQMGQASRIKIEEKFDEDFVIQKYHRSIENILSFSSSNSLTSSVATG
ncbi:glycosyltransferase family 4 protein [Xanthocytophaga agilis]|uniref:Glycosyltransferase family 4 protein n=1 Tax=Xanthocytophaga agilis TaxID=3048010 RepID=A0AAE3R9V0_9BACT|nr:glycosyltransferase family 4 protein [Xanthocytophaga agilis]MDJ1504145.1 glycosyltransferase family 4 protein [Xanthocytophaga agilis]